MRQRLTGPATASRPRPRRSISTFPISRLRIHLEGRTYLLYSVGGESGIGITEVLELGGRAGQAIARGYPSRACITYRRSPGP